MKYLLLLVLLFLFSCSDDDYSNPEALLVSAYDVLVNYSYYQDSIPDDKFAYNTPGELYYHIDDILKGGRYTFFVEGFDLDEYLGNFVVGDTKYYFGMRLDVLKNSDNGADTLFCTQVFKGSSAETGGLVAGDKIVAIDSFSLYGNGEVFNAVTSVGNKSYNFIVSRELGLDTLVVSKSDLGSPVSYSAEVTSSVGYIYLSTFLADDSTEGGSSSTQFIRSLNETTQYPVTIIDLRNNGGGYVVEALKIAAQFLTTGDTTIVTTLKGKKYGDIAEASIDATRPTVGDRKFVLLANGYSASASEILISALKHNLDIPLVGETTYGKAIGQTRIFFTQGLDTTGAAHLTVAKYLPPSLVPYEEVGITPEYPVTDSVTSFADPQLAEALRVAEELIGVASREERVISGSLHTFNNSLTKPNSVCEYKGEEFTW